MAGEEDKDSYADSPKPDNEDAGVKMPGPRTNGEVPDWWLNRGQSVISYPSLQASKDVTAGALVGGMFLGVLIFVAGFFLGRL